MVNSTIYLATTECRSYDTNLIRSSKTGHFSISHGQGEGKVDVST
jgi:hypothetical protein